jgi:DNA replication and repair protein RecF
VWIEQVHLSNFRRLEAVTVELAPGLNVLTGDNGAGKSSFLEGILALSRGRVAGGHPRERSGAQGSVWQVEARVRQGSAESGWSSRLAMRWDGALGLSLDGFSATARELSRRIIVAAVDPRSHDLFDFGPAQRRRFLDWALFHVEPNYIEVWSRWRRLLNQRNQALLRGEEDRAIAAWNAALVLEADRIDSYRQAMAESLAAELTSLAEELVGAGPTAVAYERGWKAGEAYATSLEAALDGDRRAGRSRFGPQRADLSLRVGDRLPDQLSRGQQKLLAVALMVSACRHLAKVLDRWPVLVLDDFDAELGGAAQARLAALLGGYIGQVLVTQHEDKLPPGWEKGARMFHVERGQIRRAIQ